MPDQESFFKQLMEGDMPQQFYAPYQEFLSKVRADHLLHLIFSCGCWRMIECRAIYQGRGIKRLGGTVFTPTHKYTYQWHYYYPKTQADCGARVFDESWIRRRLPVFWMRLGYHHGYADHVFREKASKQITNEVRVASDISR